MKRARPKRGKRQFRFAPIVLAFMLIILAVGSVAIAAYWYRPQPENPDDPAFGSGAFSPSSDASADASVTDSAVMTSSDADTDTDTDAISDSTSSGSTDSQGETTDKGPGITTVIPPPNDGTVKKIAFTFDDGPHYR